jgi:hypothetical protein
MFTFYGEPVIAGYGEGEFDQSLRDVHPSQMTDQAILRARKAKFTNNTADDRRWWSQVRAELSARGL